MHHLRLRFLVCCYLVLLAASAFADTNPLLKTVSASFKNIEALQFSELAALQAGNTEQAARKLNQPAVITVRGIHGLGAFRIFLTSIRHFNICLLYTSPSPRDPL